MSPYLHHSCLFCHTVYVRIHGWKAHFLTTTRTLRWDFAQADKLVRQARESPRSIDKCLFREYGGNPRHDVRNINEILWGHICFHCWDCRWCYIVPFLGIGLDGSLPSNDYKHDLVGQTIMEKDRKGKWRCTECRCRCIREVKRLTVWPDPELPNSHRLRIEEHQADQWEVLWSSCPTNGGESPRIKSKWDCVRLLLEW